SWWYRLRTIDHLSMTRPDIGNRSPRIMPGTLVGEVPNSPRYSIGASGLGSHISMWLGPPRIQRMMADFIPLAVLRFCSARNTSASDSPAAPRTPALRKPRRSRVRRNSGQPRRVVWLVIACLFARWVARAWWVRAGSEGESIVRVDGVFRQSSNWDFTSLFSSCHNGDGGGVWVPPAGGGGRVLAWRRGHRRAPRRRAAVGE